MKAKSPGTEVFPFHRKCRQFVEAEVSGEGCGAPAPGPPSLVPLLLLLPCTAVPSPLPGLARGVRASASNYFSAAVAGTELMGKPLAAAQRVLNKFATSQSPCRFLVSTWIPLSKCSKSGLLSLETCRRAGLPFCRKVGSWPYHSCDQT